MNKSSVRGNEDMKKVKILHCADLHFDTPFKELTKDISERSREELLEVFKRIIDLVIENSVQVLLISGDVFDNITVNKTTIFFIINELKTDKIGLEEYYIDLMNNKEVK